MLKKRHLPLLAILALIGCSTEHADCPDAALDIDSDAPVSCCPISPTIPCHGGEPLGGTRGEEGCELNRFSDGRWYQTVDAQGCAVWREAGPGQPGDMTDPDVVVQCCNCSD